MIKDKILVLKKESKLPNNIELPKGSELHIVSDVIYMKGFPLPQSVQGTVMNWINNNPQLFEEVFR